MGFLALRTGLEPVRPNGRRLSRALRYQFLDNAAKRKCWDSNPGASMQKLGFVPEAQNDMIYSIICEELGLFGAVCVILLFVILIWRFMVIASNAQDLYGALIVSGVLAHIAIQVILNIAVVTNTIPNTGISLPFISYGGTSVAFLLAEIGLVLSVSRGIRLEE